MEKSEEVEEKKRKDVSQIKKKTFAWNHWGGNIQQNYKNVLSDLLAEKIDLFRRDI